MTESFKQRIASGCELHCPLVFMHQTREEVEKAYQQGPADMAFLDTQHFPASDSEIIDFCRWSVQRDVPVMVRIRHPREAYLAGRYCDHGAAAVLVPLVEDPETVREAIETFYYPPVGKRSWGPVHAHCVADHKGTAYAPWWNANGVLAIQLETVEGIRRCRDLVSPGVHMVMFGGMDLQFSLDATADSPWPTVQACIDHVVTELADVDVRVIADAVPFGTLPATGGTA